MPVSTEMVWLSTPGRTSSAIEQTMLVSPVTRVTVAARTGGKLPPEEEEAAAEVTAASGTEAAEDVGADMVGFVGRGSVLRVQRRKGGEEEETDGGPRNQ